MFSLRLPPRSSSIHITSPTTTTFRILSLSTCTRRSGLWVGLFSKPPPPLLKLNAAFINGGEAASDVIGKCTDDKPPICTADELHYVSVSNSDWKLALWRYKPSPNPNAPSRNHPLLLLSGVATNAIGFDLSPESSFARYMSSQGFDTWILEVRGAGLSSQTADSAGEMKQRVNVMSEKLDSAANSQTNGILSAKPQFVMDHPFRESKISSAKGKRKKTVTKSDQSQLVTKLTESIVRLSDKFSGFLDEGRLRANQNSATIEDFQKQLDLIVKYDWDFDHYLEEDVPAAIEYIKAECKPKDGKMLAIGHSMGGILLYAMLSRHGFDGRDSGFASVVTLGSSLDYTSSKSSLKFLLPVADPAQALSVPAIPVGAMLAAAYPFTSRPPYVLSWLNPQISAQDMMHPELFEKLILNNFGTVPMKLLAQLTTAFREGGLCDRSGTFFYKDHLSKTNTPILALAGDQDLICPPEAVYETINLNPENLITYKVFGEPGGPHYAHYDLVGGRLAADQVYPCIVEFLSRHDMT